MASSSSACSGYSRDAISSTCRLRVCLDSRRIRPRSQLRICFQKTRTSTSARTERCLVWSPATAETRILPIARQYRTGPPSRPYSNCTRPAKIRQLQRLPKHSSASSTRVKATRLHVIPRRGNGRISSIRSRVPPPLTRSSLDEPVLRREEARSLGPRRYLLVAGCLLRQRARSGVQLEYRVASWTDPALATISSPASALSKRPRVRSSTRRWRSSSSRPCKRPDSGRLIGRCRSTTTRSSGCRQAQAARTLAGCWSAWVRS